MTTIVDMISNNKTTSAFVKEDNINLLWTIITNTSAFKTSISNNGAESQQKLRSYYIQHVRTFVEENIYDTSSIVEFNKKFISYFIKKFQPSSGENINTASTINNNSNTAEVQKLQIDNNSNLGKNAITIEELKTERLSEFETRYQKIQNDFDVYRKTEVPDGIDFSDKNRDRPINDNEFQQQVSTTTKERKTQETIFSNNIDDHTQAMKWLNLKEAPKALVPEPTVFDKPPPSPNNNQTNNKVEKTSENKNVLVSESNDAVVLKQTNPSDKLSPAYLYSIVVQTRYQLEILKKTVDTMNKTIKELETKIEKLDK